VRIATVSRKMLGWLSLAALIPFCAGCKSVEARRHNAVGVHLFNEGLYSAAQVSFQESLYNDPENPDTYYNLASTFHRQGQTEEAEKHYNQCLDRNPNHRRCYHSLAVLLLEDGRRDDALSLLEGWVEDRPWVPDASVELAWLYRYVGDDAAAEQQLLHALETSPRHPEALAALGSIREEQGQTGRALALYERSMAAGNRRPQVAARVAQLRSGAAPSTSSQSRFVRREEATPLR
jgi:tetratricopeptide (TPR) repeat protein